MAKKDRELVATKVGLEEQWAYDRRQERMSFRQMRQAAAFPVEQGGLGYSLGEATLKARVDAYFARIKDTLEMGIDERRARQEAEIDELIRLATGDIARARAAGDVKASADAELRLLRYQEREAKIFGTDSPQRIEADVTTHDAVADELAMMLARIPEESSS